MNEPLLLQETRGPVAILRLNRPAKRNALSDQLIAELHSAIEQIARDEVIRVVILAANGPLFCAGHDLQELTTHRADTDGGKVFFHAVMKASSALMRDIIELPKPVIACVQGLATAAGCQLAASCDLIIASETAAFATPGVDIGLFCTTPMVALTRCVAPKNAMEMLLTGEPITAARAAAIGLVNRIVPVGEELQAAVALAETIAAKPHRVVALGKAAFYRAQNLSLADAYADAVEVMTANMMLDEAREGIAAFLDKRAPHWP